MRIDKFLKANRIIKRRVMAKEAVEKGFVTKNGRPTRAGSELVEGDRVEVTFSNRILKLRVGEGFKAEIIEEIRR